MHRTLLLLVVTISALWGASCHSLEPQEKRLLSAFFATQAAKHKVPERIIASLEIPQYQTRLFYFNGTRVGREDLQRSTSRVTLVSHVTVDRLSDVVRWCETWQGPLSIAVFMRPHQDDEADVTDRFTCNDCVREHALLHVVSELESSSSSAKDMMTHYPFNVQRNAALDGCLTDLAFLMDIDFHLMPSALATESALRETFIASRRRHASELLESSSSCGDAAASRAAVEDANAAVYVVPAVETSTASVPMPETLQELSSSLASHQVNPFYGLTCLECHRPTNIKRFVSASTASTEVPAPYPVEYIRGYEPYVIVNKSASAALRSGGGFRVAHEGTIDSASTQWWRIPRYDERFVGRGWSKASYFFELSAQRRTFVVMPTHFLVHRGRGNVFKAETAEWGEAGIDDDVLSYYVRQVRNTELMQTFEAEVVKKYSNSLGGAPEVVAAPPNDTAAFRGDLLYWEFRREQHRQAKPTSNTCGDDVLCHDDLLWKATKSLRWAALASQVIMNSDSSRNQRSLHFSCIAKHRSKKTLQESAEASMVGAVSWACKRMDCSELMAPWELPKEVVRPSPLRYYPQNVVLEADWVFDRWFHQAVSDELHSARGARGAYETDDAFEALLGVTCHFGGSAALVRRQDVGGLHGSHHGCSLNPNVCASRVDLRRLLDEICNSIAVVGVRGLDSIPQEVEDAVTGQCAHLFAEIDPLVQNELWMRAAVALNAHHLIYSAGGTGKTCSARFGEIAVPISIPTWVMQPQS